MYPFYLGIDLHLKRTYLVLMNQSGEILEEQHLENAEVAGYLKQKVPPNTYAVMEATRNWPFMYDLLCDHVERVELAHPKKVKSIATAAVKTDKIDAGVLAHLARLNYLPIAYAAPKEVRDLRWYTRHRKWLVEQRTQAKNRIRAVLASYDLASSVRNLFGVKGREILEEILPTLRPAGQRVIVDHLSIIDQLDQQIKALEKEIPLTEEQKQKVKLLTSMPGVHKVTAMTILAEVGDISRFHSPKSLCNWAGLTPRVRKSDAVVRYGRISKQGSRYLRGAMVQAATVAYRFSPRWGRVHDRIAKRCGRKGAKTALARHMLTVVYYMLKRSEPYREDYPRGA
jgi:transposase